MRTEMTADNGQPKIVDIDGYRTGVVGSRLVVMKDATAHEVYPPISLTAGEWHRSGLTPLQIAKAVAFVGLLASNPPINADPALRQYLEHD